VGARRLIPLGAAVTALLALAGVASHGRPLSGGRGGGPDATFFDYVATTLLLVAVAVLVVVAYAIARGRVRAERQRSRWSVVGTLGLIGACLLLSLLITHSRFENRLHGLALPTNPATTSTTRRHAGTAAHGRNAHLRWDEIAIVLVLVGGVAAYVLLTRPKRPAPRPLLRRRRALSQALDESLDDLRRDPDVRRAIIAAYARMERALGAAGLARAPAETPFEFLRRALVALDAGGEAATRLTDLFERAKFSHHEPAEAMRDEAIDALVAVRDDLRRPVPEPVPA
jgi:4-amino-4-deoxy-L-arabinose transferase-like glycosyltransferase